MNTNKPVLYIYYNSLGEQFLNEVLAAVEEEGVLFEVRKINVNAIVCTAENLAYEAALKSILEIGIGIDGEYVCMTYSKLPKHKPLQKFSILDKANLRLAGSNAARLVKGIPLKY
jgi:hypothetical protein